MTERPWFVGAWRRRSITVPGAEPTEPCEAWWIQSADAFVDVRVAQPGHEDNGLPYSQTRAFAGRFEIVDGEVRWHLEIDSLGLAPCTDRAPADGLYISADDPLLMIEDAPGRFREEWVNHAPDSDVEVIRSLERISVRIGDTHGLVELLAHNVGGRIWRTCGGIDVVHAFL